MIYFSIVAFVLIADQLSKYIIMSHIALFESVPIISGVFNLTYVTNRGAAFSLLANVDSWWRHPFFIIIGLAAAGLLTYMYFRIREHAPVQSVGLALICGGALGNLLDRFRLGAVVDFIDLYWSEYHWPAFNIADSAICVGVGIFFVFSFIEKENNLTKRGD